MNRRLEKCITREARAIFAISDEKKVSLRIAAYLQPDNYSTIIPTASTITSPIQAAFTPFVVMLPASHLFEFLAQKAVTQLCDAK